MNALVITATESVANNELKKMDEVKVMVDDAFTPTYTGALPSVSYWKKSTGGNLPGRIAGDGHFTDNTGVQDLGKTKDAVNTYSWFTRGKYNVFIGNKKDIEKIQGGGYQRIYLSELSHCFSLKSIDFSVAGCSRGSFDDIKLLLPNLTHIYFHDKNISGDASVLNDCENLIYLRLANTTEITGHINPSKSIGLETINLGGTDSLFTFDFDEIADGMVANGRNSGTLQTYNKSGVSVVYTFTSEGWTKS